MDKPDPMTRLLLIVDPQIDFINGTLPVPGAKEAMNRLAEYIRQQGESYGQIVVTCDRHPLNHSSFNDFGGPWPPHCIESSVGAAVWPPVMESLARFYSQVRFLYKGENPAKEEYSIFGAEIGGSIMKRLLTGDRITHVDICGLAGDVCVKATLDDARTLYPGIRYRVLEDFTASINA